MSSFLKIFIFIRLFRLCRCVSMCGYVHKSGDMPIEAQNVRALGVTDGYELPDIGAGHCTSVLWSS